MGNGPFSKRMLGLAIVSALGLGFLLGQQARRPPGEKAVAAAATPLGDYRCSSGPWGDVYYSFTVIEMPPGLFSFTFDAVTNTAWHVTDAAAPAIAAQMMAAGLTEEQIGPLLAGRQEDPEGGSWLLPSDDLILSLSPPVRARWYTQLSRSPNNTEMVWPMRFQADSKLGWFDDSGLPPETMALLSRLVYRRGSLQLFSDMRLMADRVATEELGSRVMQVLSRERTLLANLEITPHTDIDAVAGYWGFPNRVLAVRTLLKTIQRAGAVRAVPLSLLLPRFPRDRLHRYRNFLDPAVPHCFYTAFIFFLLQPEEGFTNLPYAAQVLARDYQEVTNDFRLGDLILFTREEGAIHACNYLCDNLVFTKNGGSEGQPWLLERLPDLVNFYSQPDPVALHYFRRRDFSGEALARMPPSS